MAEALNLRLTEQRKKAEKEIRGFTSILEDIDRCTEELKARENRLKTLEAMMKENAEKAGAIIKLNVRGKMYETSKENLVRIDGTYFHALVSSGSWMPNADGAYFIDRNSIGFDRILDYLATGHLSYTGISAYTREVIEANLDYFLLVDAPRRKRMRSDEEEDEDEVEDDMFGGGGGDY